MNKLPDIIDTTLRDGEQSPGVAFSTENKMKIAGLLNDLGVEEVEAGTPAIGKNEQEAIKEIARAGFSFITSSWSRARADDIKQAARLGTQSLNISLPVSEIQIETLGRTRQWVLSQLGEAIHIAKNEFPRVTVGAQDASRASSGFLYDYVSQALEQGANRIRINDTVGILDPFETFQLFEGLNKRFPETDFEFHGHNDLGMATANALAACRAGAGSLSATVNGIGERAGNLALEEIIAILKYKKNDHRYNSTVIQNLSRLVEDLSEVSIPKHKPICGQNAYRHESGIHTAAIIKNRKSYQIIDPGDFGMESPTFTYGKHSGTSSITRYFKKAGLSIDRALASQLLSEVKSASADGKVRLTEKKLHEFYLAINANPA